MTTGKNINIKQDRLKILIVPLDWGLGHATRCIPIIKELIKQNCDVFIAGEGPSLSLLKQEFTNLVYLPLKGYRIKYSKKKYFLPWKILVQFPKIVFRIYKENQWLKETVKKYKIDGIISDNRFGMFHSTIPCVYITHQLLIKTGNSFTENMAQQIHYYFINKYKECWVPDFKDMGLAGELSHPQKVPKNTKYLGALSRLEWHAHIIKYDLLISISGPEPQRTIFENQILNELKVYSGRVLYIRGLPEKTEVLKNENPNVKIKNHLSASLLNEALLQSEIIISRCGYTTIMDLIKLQKKAILIPTPGQPEQEYLADYLKAKQIFYTTLQKDFILQRSLKEAKACSFAIPEFNMEQYKNIISQFVQSLNITHIHLL